MDLIVFPLSVENSKKFDLSVLCVSSKVPQCRDKRAVKNKNRKES
jgi:hypothetical protein